MFRLDLGIAFIAKATPTTVENSAKAFMEAPTRSPLLARIAKRATAEVKMLE
jgi:hypothetical protein